MFAIKQKTGTMGSTIDIAKKIVPSEMRVALLSGGTSGEREISLASGDGAQAALVEAGYDVHRFDPADKQQLKEIIDGDFDVAFLCLHGKGGECGAMQGFLETIGLPYTCSDVWGCAVAMDKAKAKVFYEKAGIPTSAYAVLTKNEWENSDAQRQQEILQNILDKAGDHVVVKVSTEGSSIGVYFAEGAEELKNAIKEAFTVGETVLIEKYVEGKELTVVVLGGDEDAEALPIIEIVPKNASYDFESKYAPGGSEHICPARLSDEDTENIQKYAVQAHNALGCHGVSRTDFIIDANGTPWVLETNTIPGMTATSLLPDAARAAGIEFPDLCTRLIASALQKAAD